MFKVPSSIAQDLLLIQDLISDPVPGPSSLKPAQERNASTESIDSDDASSDSDTDSEEVNVIEDLLTNEVGAASSRSASPSSSESSDDSDSEPESETTPEKSSGSPGKQVAADFDEDDDDEGGARIPSGSTLRTKNELPDATIITPDITEVDAQEPLEKIGEIMSVFENVVIIKGVASQVENKASERALDSESLLVFDDRKVLGYIHETFGPTYQPLYQVKFPSASSINKELVTINREVFHIPPRSHFVFPSQLKKFKGSDASNVHDEEVNEDEMEFSDDEAEAAYKQQRKRKRQGSRDSSVVSSRFSTPTPSQAHDGELDKGSFYSASPYDEFGPYDMDATAGPSRPAPLPYDDPYQDEPSSSTTSENSPMQTREDSSGPSRVSRGSAFENPRGRGRGRGRERERERERGRGRGRGREQGGRGGFGGDRRGRANGEVYGDAPSERRDRRGSVSRGAAPSSARSLSPTSIAIARATGQYADGSTFAAAAPHSPAPASMSPTSPSMQSYWQAPVEPSYNPYADPTHQMMYSGQQQGYTQPHINPRFASLFGINMNFAQGQQYSPYPVSPSPIASPYSAHTPNAVWANNGWPQNVPAGNVHSPSSTTPDYTVKQEEEYRP